MKLAIKLERLKRAAPNISPFGQLYRHQRETTRQYSRVTLWTLFVSHENTHLLRDHIFKKAEPRSPQKWAEWFSANLSDIHRNAILPGIAVRTNKQWAVQRIIGWVGDAEHAIDNPKVGRTRNKTKRQGRKNG